MTVNELYDLLGRLRDQGCGKAVVMLDKASGYTQVSQADVSYAAESGALVIDDTSGYVELGELEADEKDSVVDLGGD